MSYNPEQVLQRIRQQQQIVKPPIIDNHTVEQLFSKISSMENHIRSLETNLVHANEEISNLRTKVNPDDDYQQTDNTYDIIDTMSREPVEKILQRKEKNFNRFANGNTSKAKTPGHLKLEQLNSILLEYPHLPRPIIHIKLTEADFE